MLAENKIPDITKVKIIENGRGVRIEFGCNTHFYDKRDLFNLPTWNDRDDNRKETIRKLEQSIAKSRSEKTK